MEAESEREQEREREGEWHWEWQRKGAKGIHTNTHTHTHTHRQRNRQGQRDRAQIHQLNFRKQQCLGFVSTAKEKKVYTNTKLHTWSFVLLHDRKHNQFSFYFTLQFGYYIEINNCMPLSYIGPTFTLLPDGDIVGITVAVWVNIGDHEGKLIRILDQQFKLQLRHLDSQLQWEIFWCLNFVYFGGTYVICCKGNFSICSLSSYALMIGSGQKLHFAGNVPFWWTHVVVVVHGSHHWESLNVYNNAQFIGSSNQTATKYQAVSDPLIKLGDVGVEVALDELGIWLRDLSPEEIGILYNSYQNGIW